VGQKLVVTAPAVIGAKAITNDTWAASAAHLRQVRGFGGTLPPAGRSVKSLDRYVRAAFACQSLDASRGAEVAAALPLLASVAVGKRTQWNIVYEPAARRVHFKTRTSPTLKHLDLDALTIDCAAPVRALDIDHTVAGDAAGALVPLTRAQNLALVEKSMRETRRPVPREAAAMLAAYPESFTCTVPPAAPATAPGP
jgi:hypothetical protein